MDLAKNHRESAADLNFLSRLRHTEDKVFLLRWLNDPSFYTVFAVSSILGPSKVYMLTSNSYKRLRAERFFRIYRSKQDLSYLDLLQGSPKHLGVLIGQVA